MILQSQLTPDDYVAFMEYFYKRLPEGRRTMRRLYFLGLLLFIGFSAMEARSPERGISRPEVYGPYLLFSALLFFPGYWLLLTWMRQTFSKLRVQWGEKRDLLLPAIYEFFPGHVEVRTSGGTGRIAWTHIHDVVLDQERIYLLLGGPNAFILTAQEAEGDSPTESLFATLCHHWEAAHPEADLN